jgi:hypothetical protein
MSDNRRTPAPMDRVTWHVREAELYLRLAADQRANNRFADPQTASLLLGLSQAHTALAALPGEVTRANEALAEADAAMDAVLCVVAGHLCEMSVSEVPQVRKWASGIASELDHISQNVDGRMQARAESLGVGQHLFDYDGVRYSLLQQYVDAKGKRWEHTGDWTAQEQPLMRREDKPETVLTLPDLIAKRGRLLKLAAVGPPSRPLGYSDEPPF